MKLLFAVPSLGVTHILTNVVRVFNLPILVGESRASPQAVDLNVSTRNLAEDVEIPVVVKIASILKSTPEVPVIQQRSGKCLRQIKSV